MTLCLFVVQIVGLCSVTQSYITKVSQYCCLALLKSLADRMVLCPGGEGQAEAADGEPLHGDASEGAPAYPGPTQDHRGQEGVSGEDELRQGELKR